MSPEVVEVAITARDEEWLNDFVRALASDRLIAAGNVSGPIRSHYWWRGVLEDQIEYRVTMHTRAELVPAIVDRTNRDHPYEVPCVIATPIAAGNPAYLNWVIEETEKA